MKHLILGIIALVLAATLVYAAPFAATAFRTYSITKATTYKIKGKHGIAVQSSNATSVYLNGAGDDWALPANTPQDFYPFQNISTLRFTCTSTAAASPTKIRIQEF